MSSITQEIIQEFSNRIASICTEMELEQEEVLQLIGATFIGAARDFEYSEYSVEVPGVASLQLLPYPEIVD